MCILLVIVSCQAKPRVEQTQSAQDFADLKGTWTQGRPGLYHTLYVQDSIHIVLDTHIDTMFSYTYRLEADTLFLYNEFGNQVNYDLIHKLTEDSLVFESLLDRAGEQKYARKKTP